MKTIDRSERIRFFAEYFQISWFRGLCGRSLTRPSFQTLAAIAARRLLLHAAQSRQIVVWSQGFPVTEGRSRAPTGGSRNVADDATQLTGEEADDRVEGA